MPSVDVGELFVEGRAHEAGGSASLADALNTPSLALGRWIDRMQNAGMKVYVSWSGELARHASEVLRYCLGLAFPRLDVWVTESDIAGGLRWVDEIQSAIRTSDLAIVCVTKDSLLSPWINFELGILAASGSRVVPWVIDLEPSELRGPLAQYQAADSLERLIRAIAELDNGSAPPERARVAEWSREFDERIRHLTGRGLGGSTTWASDEWGHRLEAAVSTHNLDELRSIRAATATHSGTGLPMVRALLHAHMKLRDFEGLIESYETFRDAAEGNAECQSLLAFALLRTDQYEKAISVLLATRQLAPDNPEILGLLGQAYKNHWRKTGVGDSLRHAVDAYAEGFQLAPSLYHLGTNAVELLHLLGDDRSIALRDRLLPAVERSARQEFERDPNDPWALASLLEMAIVKNEPAEAEELARRLQAHDPWVRSSTARQLHALSGAETPEHEPADWVRELIIRLER